MTNSTIYSTKHNNLYLYNMDLSLSMLIHPELSNIHKKQTNKNSYYSKKYAYLKKQGFFMEAKPIEFKNILEDSAIKENIRRCESIVFETTDCCNLNCQYCSLGELYNFSKKEHKNIDTKYAINLLKYIFSKKNKNDKLTIGFFGGEPLMNAKFIKTIVENAKLLNIEKKIDLDFSITTNATLIDKHLTFLVKNNFKILISLDGDEKAQSYRTFALNGNNSYSKVINNIDNIYKKYPEYFSKRVDFNSVLHNRNSIKEIHDFIYNRYNKKPFISPLNTDHINIDKKYILEKMFHSAEKNKNDSEEIDYLHDQSESFNELKKFIRDLSVNFYLFNLLSLLYDKVNLIPTGTCSHFQRRIYLNTNHNLLPCEKVSYIHSLGNVNNNINIDISKILEKYNFLYNHFKKICKQCYLGKNCHKCILTMDNLDKLGTDDFSCVDFQDQKSFEKKLSRIFSFLEKYPNDFSKIINSLIIE